MTISCLEINQTINELLIAFQDCNKIKNSDLRRVVELIAAVNICANGGTHYDTLVQETYHPTSDQIVTYLSNTYHSISVMVLSGKIKQTINSVIVEYPTGTTLNHELTTLNQLPFVFIAEAGSIIVVEYLVETI